MVEARQKPEARSQKPASCVTTDDPGPADPGGFANHCCSRTEIEPRDLTHHHQTKHFISASLVRSQKAKPKDNSRKQFSATPGKTRNRLFPKAKTQITRPVAAVPDCTRQQNPKPKTQSQIPTSFCIGPDSRSQKQKPNPKSRPCFWASGTQITRSPEPRSQNSKRLRSTSIAQSRSSFPNVNPTSRRPCRSLS